MALLRTSSLVTEAIRLDYKRSQLASNRNLVVRREPSIDPVQDLKQARRRRYVCGRGRLTGTQGRFDQINLETGGNIRRSSSPLSSSLWLDQVMETEIRAFSTSPNFSSVAVRLILWFLDAARPMADEQIRMMNIETQPPRFGSATMKAAGLRDHWQ